MTRENGPVRKGAERDDVRDAFVWPGSAHQPAMPPEIVSGPPQPGLPMATAAAVYMSRLKRIGPETNARLFRCRDL